MSNKEQPKKSSREIVFKVLRQIVYSKLYKKYSSGNFSYDKISINNLIFNGTCLVVARFKDYLIYDDNTEFLRRFYLSKDCDQRLKKILIFYETYSKIFPNYLVLKENKYLYRNIRKKQKMIDAINEIKREEKENKKKLKEKGGLNGKKNVENNELFTRKIKEEIKTFQKNISFKNYKNSFDTNKDVEDTILMNPNSISISILNWKQYEKNSNTDKMENEDENIWGTKIDSFLTNQTNGSISGIVNVLNDNKIYTNELANLFLENNIKENKNSSMKKQNTKNLQKNNKKENDSGKNKATITKKLNSKEITSQNIKSNNDKKKINDKNNIYKYTKTSSNVTNSSSILSKRIKNQIKSSSVTKNKLSKENKENKENEKNIISNINTISSNPNIHQKTLPKLEKLELKKHFFKTNNNFNTKSSLSKHKNKKNKEILSKNKNSADKKEKEKVIVSTSNENIMKKSSKSKQISQDLDSNTVPKVTDNVLNSNNTKNFLTENPTSNPNLITGDTKDNDKNALEDKVHVNVRDMIKNNKENEKKNNLLNTAQKLKTQKKENLLLKLPKNKTNKHLKTKSMNIPNNNFYQINDSKKNNDMIKEHENETDIDDDKKKINNELAKQKTENKIKNKKLLAKDHKAKTKTVFNKNKMKNIENMNINDIKENKLIEKKDKKEVVIKSEENIIKENNINAKQGENKNNEVKINESKKEENNIQKDNENIKEEETKDMNIDTNNIEDEVKNNIDKEKEKENIENINNEKVEQNKEEITNTVPETNKKYYNIKSEPNECVIRTIENRNTEREIVSSMSEPNVNINKKDYTPEKNKPKKSITKKYIKKVNHNNYIKNLNNSAKVISTEGKQRYKTFLLKSKYRANHYNNNNNSNSKNQDANHNSQENLISINILNRIQEVKKSKTKNNFYKTSKKKNSIEVNNSNTTKSIHVKNSASSHNNKIIRKGNTITTPIIKNKKIELFKKNNTNRKLNNFKGFKPGEDLKSKYMSSFSIKVNRTYFKKDKNQNLKKTISKNKKKVFGQNDNDLKKENKDCKK